MLAKSGTADRIDLPTAHIDVWLSYYDAIKDSRLLDEYRSVISPTERAQEPRFYFPTDRQRYLVTRAAVRTILSRYATLAPNHWMFSDGPFGRPMIANAVANHDGLTFNVSHTHALIVIAIARHRAIGVDVENLSAREIAPALAKQFFSPIEVRSMEEAGANEQQERFWEYWTFKEAYIKARGMGLSIPLNKFSFQYPHAQGVEIEIDPALADNAKRWRFWQLRPNPEYLIALCAERNAEDVHLTVRHTVPLVDEQVVATTISRMSL